MVRKTLPMAYIEIVEPPGLQGMRLGLINADFPTGPLPPDIMRAVIAAPAYWAFCWGSGAALAAQLLAQPELVANKVVADLGAGSGVVAIAAKRAGAKRVWACDNDPDALQACRYNAALNGTQLEYCGDLSTLPDNLDTLFMADVLYDRSNFALLAAAKAHARALIIADSRVSSVEDEEFACYAVAEALTFPNLGEFDEFKTVRFFRCS
jgi:predicted nicotinamide N-methyase